MICLAPAKQGRLERRDVVAGEISTCYHRAMTTTSKPLLSIRDADGMGRGVFAARTIRQGDIIEVCPVIPLSKDEEEKLSGTVLDHYMFAWDDVVQRSCIAL